LRTLHIIQEPDFNNAWYKAIQNVLNDKCELIFGSNKNEKHAWDSCQIIELTGNAIKQVETKTIHPHSTFRAIEQYCNQFTDEFVKKQQRMHDDDIRKHPYTYYERLTQFDEYPSAEYDGSFNQLENMKRWIKMQQITEISSNQCQSITWYTERDNRTDSQPCMQRLWTRWYPNNSIDLHIDWRSRDLFAWQSNIIAITEMMNREVIKPNKCTLARIIDYSDSLHIYEADIAQAQKIKRMDTFHGV
jgi:thymidylate synthase